MKHYHFDFNRPLKNSELLIVLLDTLQIRAIPTTAEEAAQLGSVETFLFDRAGGDIAELHNLAQAITEILLAQVPPGEFANFDFEQFCEIVNNSDDPRMVTIALLRNGAFAQPCPDTGAVRYSTAPLGVACTREIHLDGLWWDGEEFQRDTD